jgi:tetratricopeptide (TPR) repeat protein
MIVRDEEANLPACLGPLAGVFDEVVVVDTGSTDRTREAAAALGARVFDVPWMDDFAAARNAALDRATGSWAFRLDADDRFEPAEVGKLRALLAGLTERPEGLTLRYRHDLGRRSIELDEVRLFPIRKDVRWEYRVHEQIRRSITAAGGVIRPSGVALGHRGYREPSDLRCKLERNLRLLELDRRDHSADPFIGFYLGWTRLDLGDAEGAIEPLADVCQSAPSDYTLLARAYSLLVRANQQLGRQETAEVVRRTGRAVCPDDAELAYLEAEAKLVRGDSTGAATLFQDLLTGKYRHDGRTFDEGVCGWRVRHGLAVSLPVDRNAERERLWRDAIAECPGFAPAWLGLGEMLSLEGRWSELRRLSTDLDKSLPDSVQAVILRARYDAGRGDYRGAKRRLTSYRKRHPGDVLAGIVLLQVLMLEGRDRSSAERVLAELRAAAPERLDLIKYQELLDRWQ